MRRLYSLVLQSFLSLSSSGRGTAERPKSAAERRMSSTRADRGIECLDAEPLLGDLPGRVEDRADQPQRWSVVR